MSLEAPIPDETVYDSTVDGALESIDPIDVDDRQFITLRLEAVAGVAETNNLQVDIARAVSTALVDDNFIDSIDVDLNETTTVSTEKLIDVRGVILLKFEPPGSLPAGLTSYKVVFRAPPP